MEVADLPAVAVVHARAFPDSVLTRLGGEVVEAYYRWLLVGPHDSVAAVASTPAVVGFVAAGHFRGAVGGFVRQNLGMVFWAVMRRPSLLVDPAVRSKISIGAGALVRVSRQAWHRDGDETGVGGATERPFGLLAIAVEPDYQGTGAAHALTAEVQKAALAAGATQMRLTVSTDNPRAVSFYEREGWVREVTEGHQWVGGMTKQIG